VGSQFNRAHFPAVSNPHPREADQNCGRMHE
jgi:hypothetical protein